MNRTFFPIFFSLFATFSFVTGCSNLTIQGRSLYSSVPASGGIQNLIDDELTSRSSAAERTVQNAIQNRDIVLGMSMEEVREAWGTPTRVETAGEDDASNQRWTYRNGLSQPWDLGGARIVVFESGRVAGWQTQ
jgi:hypothetical protein